MLEDSLSGLVRYATINKLNYKPIRPSLELESDKFPDPGAGVGKGNHKNDIDVMSLGGTGLAHSVLPKAERLS